uniref:Uncharacterized protein n=1 Tax=Rhizophora mucronata TaxID=61149 RepID=A0A2P2R099_RHIMU
MFNIFNSKFSTAINKLLTGLVRGKQQVVHSF